MLRAEHGARSLEAIGRAGAPRETNGASAFALAPSFDGYVMGYRYSDFTDPQVVLRVGVALGQPEPRVVETPAPPCQRA